MDVGHLPLLARLSGTLCPRTCVIRMFLRTVTVTGSHWRRFYFRSTSVFSALEVFTRMRYINLHLTLTLTLPYKLLWLNWISQSINQINQWINQSNNQSINQLVNKIADCWPTKFSVASHPGIWDHSTVLPIYLLSGRRSLRSSGTNRLVVPPFRLSTVGSRAFPVAAAKIWNALPDSLVSIRSSQSFRRHLKTFLFQRCFS